MPHPNPVFKDDDKAASRPHLRPSATSPSPTQEQQRRILVHPPALPSFVSSPRRSLMNSPPPTPQPTRRKPFLSPPCPLLALLPSPTTKHTSVCIIPNTKLAMPAPRPREAPSSPPPSLLDQSPTSTITAFARTTMDGKAIRAPRRASWAPNVVIPTMSFTSGAGCGKNDPAASSPFPTLISPSDDPPPSPASPIPTSSASIPLPSQQKIRQLKLVRLPRGGTYVATCVGPIQIGIPPETIKDCLNAGLSVPRHYVVPPQRFNRQLGSALGTNVCEFEFPAYYSFFFQRQSLNLIVDSLEVEDKIRAVFQETLFGPLAIDADADFAPGYPMDKRPDLLKESLYFRKFGDTFLEINMILQFTHFDAAGVATVETQTADGTTAVVQITKSPLHGGEYHLQEILPPLSVSSSPASSPTKADYHSAEGEADSPSQAPHRQLPGTATMSGIIQLRNHSLRYSGSSNLSSLNNSSMGSLSSNPEAQPFFIPPAFGVTVLGSSHGFDSKGSTSGYVLWIGRRGIMIDPPPYSSSVLEKQQIHPSVIDGVLLTHCHADHDAGTFQKLLCEKRITLYTTSTIYESFIRKYSALSGIDAAFLKSTHQFRPVKVGGQEMRLRGASFNFFYSLHSIPCIGLEVFFAGKSIVFSADHCNDPMRIEQMHIEGVLSAGRRTELLNFPWNHDLILHEAGVPPIHTPLATLEALDDEIKEKMYLVHVSEDAVPKESKLKVAPVGVKNTLEVQVDVPEFSEAISVLSLVGDIHFLADLTLPQARGLLEIGYKKRYAAGEVVVPKGSTPTDFYVLSIGLLEVTYPREDLDDLDEEENAEEEKVKRVHWSIGDYFGEAVFTPHTATLGHDEVRALTDVELIVFAGSELRYLLADAPSVSRGLLQCRYFSSSSSLSFHSSSMRLELLLTFNYTLNSLTRAQKLQLESIGEVRMVKAGEYVWMTGETAAYSVLIETGLLTYEGRGGQLMKSLGSLLYRRRGSISSSASGVAAIAASAAASTAAVASSFSSPLPSSIIPSNPSVAAYDDVLVQGEDATQSPCPPSFGKGNFVGSLAHSSSLLVTSNLHRQAHNLVALTDATLIIFPADRMTSFFQANPGVFLCVLDAEFVL